MDRMRSDAKVCSAHFVQILRNQANALRLAGKLSEARKISTMADEMEQKHNLRRKDGAR